MTDNNASWSARHHDHIHEFHGRENELFRLVTLEQFHKEYKQSRLSVFYTILWNRAETSTIVIDDIPMTLPPDTLSCCTPTNYVSITTPGDGIVLQFNREFYCIQQHDAEVSCIGLLFYGSGGFPLVNVMAQREQFSAMLTLFQEELNIHDHIQSEMLHVILKRWIILATRLFRTQSVPSNLPDASIDVVRQFHVLVEQNFRTKHSVAEYAEMMHKSPKTLSNLFAKYNQLTPREIIHSRIVVEAKRLLVHTDLQIKEISFMLGFDDVQNFSRFFKNIENISPIEYKQKYIQTR